MGAGASGPLPACDDLQINQKEEIDDGAVVLELCLDPETDPRQLTQRIFSVPSSLFEASIRLPAKHGGLLEPMPLKWMHDELIFLVSGNFLVAQAACKAVLPEGVSPASQKWANSCINITCGSESLHASISYLQAKPRQAKPTTSVSYALWFFFCYG